MRKLLIFQLIVILLCVNLVGCKGPEEYANPTGPNSTNIESNQVENNHSSEQLTSTEPDTAEASLRITAAYRPQDRGYNFVETADYYYYLYNGFVFFSEKEKPAFYYLCSKPDCTHGGEDCNAYGGGEGGALGYWDGKLYTAGFLDQALGLVRMDLDGSNHELVTQLEVPVDANGQAGGSYSFHFANGYLYYFVIATPKAFFRTDLSTGHTERLFKDILADGTRIMEYLRFDGDYMYFILIEPDGSRKLCRTILPGSDIQEILAWSESIPTWTVMNGVIYYYDNAIDNGRFCEYDVDAGKTTKQVVVSLGEGNAYYDPRYVYLVTWTDFPPKDKEFYVFDREYRLIFQSSLHNWTDYLYAVDSGLLISDYSGRKITYYLPFSEMEHENAEFQKVKDPYALR